MKTVEELASEAGDDWDSTQQRDKDFLKRFAALYREALVQELVAGSGEPVSATQIPLTDDQRKALSVDRPVEIGAAPGVKKEPMACPLCLESSPTICSAGYCDVCEAQAFTIELRRQHSRIAELEAQHSDIAVIAYLDAKKESAKRIAELEAALDVALEAMERGSNILSSLTYRQWDTGIHPAGIDILPRIKVAHEQAHDAIAMIREVRK